MRQFVKTCDLIAATTKKLEKLRLLTDLFADLSVEDAAQAAVFLTGRAFPLREERVLSVGGAQLTRIISTLAGADAAVLSKSYRAHGDLGNMAEHMLTGRQPDKDLSLKRVGAAFAQLAALRSGPQKFAVLKNLFEEAAAGDIKYIVKIITGDMRIGSKENLVEEAIAKAFEAPLNEVRRANMLTGDIGETLRCAARKELSSVKLKLFNPLGFMLATPVETAAEIFNGQEPRAVIAEEKYDGIRAQLHKGAGAIKFFSRTLDEVTEFPELNSSLAALPGDLILDGEILAWRGQQPLPFTELQKRLGRKQLNLYLQQEIPVRFVAFDILFHGSELLIDSPLSHRRSTLERLLGPLAIPGFQIAPANLCDSAASVEQAFHNSLAAGHEGIVVKVPDSLYTPGRRGRSWFKLKQPYATLDVVVTAVEYGHGKRHGVLSDYTFAVRDGQQLLNIGKAYSGLTDAEILKGTEFFLQHTTEDLGAKRIVQPAIVIEVAFNNIQKSARHASGYALRFPRIVRLRPDKRPAEIDSLDRVAQLYAKQITLAEKSSESLAAKTNLDH